MGHVNTDEPLITEIHAGRLDDCLPPCPGGHHRPNPLPRFPRLDAVDHQIALFRADYGVCSDYEGTEADAQTRYVGVLVRNVSAALGLGLVATAWLMPVGAGRGLVGWCGLSLWALAVWIAVFGRRGNQ